MELVIFTGNRGVGKTLGMSLYALYLKGKTGCDLYSNYGLNGSQEFSSFIDFKSVAASGHSLVLLDECHNDIDSRDLSSATKYFSHIVFYLRKLDCTLFMSTPLFSNVSARVRNVTNVLVNVSKNKKFFFYDFYDVQRDFFHVKRFRLVKDSVFDFARDVYDTKAIVTPLSYPQNKKEFEDLLKDIKKMSFMR